MQHRIAKKAIVYFGIVTHENYCTSLLLFRPAATHSGSISGTTAYRLFYVSVFVALELTQVGPVSQSVNAKQQRLIRDFSQ